MDGRRRGGAGGGFDLQSHTRSSLSCECLHASLGAEDVQEGLCHYGPSHLLCPTLSTCDWSSTPSLAGCAPPPLWSLTLETSSGGIFFPSFFGSSAFLLMQQTSVQSIISNHNIQSDLSVPFLVSLTFFFFKDSPMWSFFYFIFIFTSEGLHTKQLE